MALKWSFVRAFCLGDKTEQEMIDKDLFEQWLGQLAGVSCTGVIGVNVVLHRCVID